MSDQRLTAIVTGASSGLGLAIAKALLSRDFNVVMNGSNQERLDAAYQSVGSPEAALPEETLLEETLPEAAWRWSRRGGASSPTSPLKRTCGSACWAGPRAKVPTATWHGYKGCFR